MEEMMKIAVPVKKDSQIDDHFGQCEFYSVFTISDQKEIVKIDCIKSEKGCGCKSDIAKELASQGVSVLLAGGIGNGAINVLKTSGINVIRGCSGNAQEVARQYISGLVEDSGSSCQHHENDAEHVCSH